MAICKNCLCYDVCEARITSDENYPEKNTLRTTIV